MKPQIHASPGQQRCPRSVLSFQLKPPPSQEFCSHLIPLCFLLLFHLWLLAAFTSKRHMVNKLEKNSTKILHPQIIPLGFFCFPSSSRMLDAILFTVRWFLVSSVLLLLKTTLGFLVPCSSISMIRQRISPLESLAGLSNLMLI